MMLDKTLKSDQTYQTLYLKISLANFRNNFGIIFNKKK